MPDKKQESFTVTDRRLFNAEGELRHDAEEEAKPEAKVKVELKQESKPAPAPPPAEPQPSASQPSPPDHGGERCAPPPTAEEQKEQAEAYRKSAKQMDTRVELSGASAREFEMTFERFMASLYMTAMMQMGLMHEQGGQPRIDLIGARQTIDTLGLLAEKTKGNLNGSEEIFLQNCLYELRMAYVDVTNALTHPPDAPGKGTGATGR